ncbi:MAG TPA: SRPBCC family protein [Mycobacteriales bacterium]|nr:SRPBCC family protein [Mycobacteriales bacterium]
MASYDVRVRSDATPEQLFALLADAAGWSRWAGPLISHSSWVRDGDPAPGGVGAVRRVGSKLIATREEILEYDPPHYLAYTILSWQPIRDYRAIVSFDRDGDGTRITWAAAFEPMIPGTGRIYAWVLGKIVGGLAVRLGRFAAEQARGEK